MQFLTLFTLFSFVSTLVLAQPVNINRRHAHNMHRRNPSPVAEAEPDVVYVTVQATVTAQAYENAEGVVVVTAVVDQWGNPVQESTTSSAPAQTVVSIAPPVVAAPVPTSSESSPAPESSSVYVAPSPVYVAPSSSVEAAPSSVETSSSVYVAPSSSSVYVAPSSISSAVSMPSETSAPSNFGGSKGIVYSPYNADGTCKSTSQVASDVAQFSSYEVIRLYGVDCDQVPNVWAAKSSSQKLFLGIFDVSAVQSAISTIASTAGSYSWDDVYTVAVGNELVNSGQKTAAEVVILTNTARSLLRAVGYNGPVVNVDTFVAVYANPSLCECSDYAAINCHPFFDGTIPASGSGDFVAAQISKTAALCSKDVLITESGWPKHGQANGVAVPSPENHDIAIESLVSTVGPNLIEFTAFNDYWKADGPYGAEKYWGILDA
ncbi:glycoside hydrolase superfamily [Lipomyces arxii]|uniref:glycoside hydrolase superfamily n=1 Tax=Lipomyces arxii TaxID=56418 RepID=UPI0034CDE401